MLKGMIPSAKAIEVDQIETAFKSSDKDFKAQYVFIKPSKTVPIISYCQIGVRSSSERLDRSHAFMSKQCVHLSF